MRERSARSAREHLHRNYRKARYVLYRETLIDPKGHIIAFIGAFAGIALIGFINSPHFLLNDNLFIIGSFGASAVLVYGIPNSPLAQPRNLLGGHVISAFTGVTVQQFVPMEIWFCSALAVSLSIVLMQITRTLHPPGGATALIAVIGSVKIKSLGYIYVISPVLAGCLILLLIALVFNNLGKKGSYPARKLQIPAFLGYFFPKR